ncbi:MAG: bifunctional adenosylcobinamide kinase/adenosylcobinamide-phosphate guanylyltransferase [Chloroflexi bacterium]|nr:bifunctional adenosylcobinamide kinase/adenosylcobinamide-phosphate guanylyltransferase [Chloroflexota bacterium]
MAEKIVFILGGARSGKSHFAQEMAGKISNKVLFVATGEPRDEEMQARIEKHKKARPKSWHTVEAPTNIGKHIEAEIGDAEVVVLDCLTLLVSNLLGERVDYEKAEKPVMAEVNSLISSINKINATFIIVSNEVGMGLVPETPLGRIYRDLLGTAHQLIAQRANEVYLVVAGIPVRIKGE